MLKTLKYIVLFTVMLVNVTPYIKDGKVEWKANEAAAQNYVCESNWFQLLFGVYKCVNTQNQADWFKGESSACSKTNNQCICSDCHHLFTCNGSATKCSDCLEVPSNEDNPENPEDESTDNPEEENTEPGSTTPPGGSAGTGDSGSGGSGTGTGGTTSQAVIRLSSHDCNLDLGEPYNLEVEIEGCTVNSITFLVDGLELQKGTSTTCKLYPTKPGTFNIKVKVNDNPNLVSNIEEVEVKFPPVWKISEDAIVESSMNSALEAMLDDFDNSIPIQREYGFLIYLRTGIQGCEYFADDQKLDQMEIVKAIHCMLI